MRAGKYGGTISWRIVDSKDEDHTDGQGALAGVNLLEENHPAKTGKPFFLADLCGLPFARAPQRQIAQTHFEKSKGHREARRLHCQPCPRTHELIPS